MDKPPTVASLEAAEQMLEHLRALPESEQLAYLHAALISTRECAHKEALIVARFVGRFDVGGSDEIVSRLADLVALDRQDLEAKGG